MNSDLTKVAIITAAGQGMGAACARELSVRGYQVSLMSTSERSIELAEALKGIGMQGSVTNPSDLRRLVNLTMTRYGRIDVVVNNTGHPPKGELIQITDDEWHTGLDLVMLNVARMARLVTPVMRQQGGGSIINISTFAAFEPSLAFPVSSALRAALGSYTKLYAERYAAEGIRMNNVLPGYIESYPISNEIQANIPMGRQGTVVEIAKTVAFLASTDASYITGQNIRVDGGITRSV